MMNIQRFLLVFLLVVLPMAATAQSDLAKSDLAQTDLTQNALVKTLDPDLVQRAQNGDAYAAYEGGYYLSLTWQEPYLEAALDFFTAAYSRADETDSGLYLKAQSALMIGRIRAALSDFTDGLVFSEHAEDIARTLTNDPNAPGLVGTAMLDRANNLASQSRYKESLEVLEILENFYQEQPVVDEVNLSYVHSAQGWANQSLGRFEGALKSYGAALAFYAGRDGLAGQDVSATLAMIGWVKHRMGDYKGAEPLARDALKILEAELGPMAQNTSSQYINLALTLFELERPEEAIAVGMRSMPFIAANRKQSLDHQRWLFELFAKAFAAQQNPERAIFFGKLAVNAQQEIRATNTRDNDVFTKESQNEWRRLYQLLADLLITQGRISEAQAVLNMEKEEEVFNYLKRDAQADITKTRATLNDQELTEQDKLEALAALPIAADAALRALTDKLGTTDLTEDETNQVFLLQDALQKTSDQFDAAVLAFLSDVDTGSKETLEKQFDATGSYQATLETLPRPTAILQIATLPDALHLFVTLPSLTLHHQIAISRADLARVVFETLQAIETTSPDAPEKLHALQQLVFAPVAQELKDAGVEVVMLNLDGFLRYVPFAALYDGDHYMIEDFAFVQFTPAIETRFIRPDRAGAKTAGFGVTEAHPGFSPLPGVRAELATIFGSAQGEGVLNGTTALDASFDERSLKKTLLKAPEILHIASHFNLMPGQEDDSFLLLGDGEHLPLGKIRSTRALSFKGIDLLTLSACQTARGTDGDGAEIDGFGTTAQLNGAGAVMASLWPVSDAATPILMRDFYAGIMQNGLDKAEALRQAQIKMLHSTDIAVVATDRAAAALDAPEPKAKAGFDHPYFWSAFVLMGNWL
ncbi:CHAT domain-containing protein [Pseudorhodobacter sp. W20_MBD10_FR17]|uniref:CHAT domain-containing protein n=1 Tax=Pseudorhodobacter sp. W20_MBD10_FR17 TaxID=3240266 RepID=UPI003F9545B1